MHHALFFDRPSDQAPDLRRDPVPSSLSSPKPKTPRKRSILVSFRPHKCAAYRYSRNPIANRPDR